MCQVCDYGTYALHVPSYFCEDCDENAECLGGDQISLHQGYWRSGPNSTYIIKCYSDKACIGGLYTGPDALCGVGYGGNLCH